MGKKKPSSDLGRAIARKSQRDAAAKRDSATTQAGQMAAALGRHTVNADTRARLHSVLDANDLEELMLNATMADTDFTPERRPGPLAAPTVVVTPGTSSSLRAHGGTKAAVARAAEQTTRRELDRTALRIPRRPPWDASTSYGELMRRETQSFLSWRRAIAETEEAHALSGAVGSVLLTPFEKNLEVWRQLWRVVERADVVVQIVDARNPLLYYCDDLFRYVVREMDRAHVLLLNKADLLSSAMIDRWHTYFENRGVHVLFFSAFKESVHEKVDDDRVIDTEELLRRLEQFERRAPTVREDQRLVVGMCGYPNVGKSSTINVLLEATAVRAEAAEEQESTQSEQHTAGETGSADSNTETSSANDRDDTEHKSRPATTHVDLMPLPSEFSEFSASLAASVRDGPGSSVAPSVAGDSAGAVGAATKAAKRVAVSSTPGKTKHFQTLVVNERVMLCDCPGLVFPNFSSSKAELICAGVLSIDTMRGDYVTPVSLIAARIPASTLEGVYGIRFGAGRGLGRGRYVDGDTLLETHAKARGFMTDHGRPDGSRSARVLLKDFVNGRLVFAHAPPSQPGSGGTDGASGKVETAAVGEDNDNVQGESGVGPAVFAKKGRLMYLREEANDEPAPGEVGSVLGTLEGRGDEGVDELVGLDEMVGKGGAGAQQGGMGAVRARISGSRKDKDGGGGSRRRRKKQETEFVRVERRYNATTS